MKLLLEYPNKSLTKDVTFVLTSLSTISATEQLLSIIKPHFEYDVRGRTFVISI